ncbi:MAG: hypothetical protein JSS14_25285 [Proteobacteria bacterium]|nr:hypothetical protein [Pseudomonadota bacterium]
MTQPSINDCKLSFTCSRAWDSLQGLSDETRFCDSCNTQVHAVRSIRDFERRQKLGHCIAIIRDEEQSVATVGMIDLHFDTGRPAFDPILFRSIQELELPSQVEALLLASEFHKIGDLSQGSEGAVAAVLDSDQEALKLVKAALASRGLTLGMQIEGWTVHEAK